MHRVRLITLAIFTAVLVLSGCNDQKKQNTLLTEETPSSERSSTTPRRRSTLKCSRRTMSRWLVRPRNAS